MRTRKQPLGEEPACWSLHSRPGFSAEPSDGEAAPGWAPRCSLWPHFCSYRNLFRQCPGPGAGVAARGLPLQTLKYRTRGYSLTSQQDHPSPTRWQWRSAPKLALISHRMVRRWPGERVAEGHRARAPRLRLRWPSGHLQHGPHPPQDQEARPGPSSLCLGDTAFLRTDPPFPLLPLGISAPHILS